MTDQIAPESFNPSEDQKAFRNALSRFTTGITIVTALTPEGPVGITVNSFSSVSLDPPLVLWSPDKNSKRYDDFINAETYAIHVLSAEQRNVCDAFSRSKKAFGTIDHIMDSDGIPIIPECLAVFKCKKFKDIDAGDHSIIIGEVQEVRDRKGRGLTFSNGTFGVTAH